MIKIQRIAAPDLLTNDVKQKLTDEFKKDNSKTIWNKSYIRKQLLEMSHNKCCYCECFIGSGNNEMHVEHYMPKKLYPDLVVEWNNLLPSCGHCNKNKGEHDTGVDPIINPTKDDPKDYLYLKLYRYRSKSSDPNSIGKRTIDVLSLNDSDDNVIERYQLGEVLQNKIQDILDYAVENENVLCSNTRRKNRVLNTCRDILKCVITTAEYSAFMATIIHNDDSYLQLKKLLESNGLWNSELQELHDDSFCNKYDTEK